MSYESYDSNVYHLIQFSSFLAPSCTCLDCCAPPARCPGATCSRRSSPAGRAPAPAARSSGPNRHRKRTVSRRFEAEELENVEKQQPSDGVGAQHGHPGEGLLYQLDVALVDGRLQVYGRAREIHGEWCWVVHSHRGHGAVVEPLLRWLFYQKTMEFRWKNDPKRPKRWSQKVFSHSSELATRCSSFKSSGLQSSCLTAW